MTDEIFKRIMQEYNASITPMIIGFMDAEMYASIQRWLREENRLRVFVEQKTGGDFGFVIYTPNQPELAAGQPWIRHSHFTEHFATYEQALCAGINAGVGLIEKPQQ